MVEVVDRLNLIAESLEERIHVAVVRFCRLHPGRTYNFRSDPSNDNNDLVISIGSGTNAQFKLSVDRDHRGELKQPVYIKHGTPDKQFYNIFCRFLDENGDEFSIRYREYMPI